MDNATRRTPDLDRALDAWESKIQSGCEQIEDWTINQDWRERT